MKKLGMMFVVVCWIQTSAQATTLVDRALDLFATNEFSLVEDRFQGRWQNSSHWSGTFCDGYWAYQGNLWGRIENLEFDMNADESVNVVADLRSIGGSLHGQYKAWQTACLEVGAGKQLSVPWADIRGVVNFVENSEGKIKVRLRITRTVLGKVETHSEWIPDWIEESATSLLNYGLEKVWQSELGEKISERVSQFLAEKLPNGALPF